MKEKTAISAAKLLSRCAKTLFESEDILRKIECYIPQLSSSAKTVIPTEIQRLDELTQTVHTIAEAIKMTSDVVYGSAPDISNLTPQHIRDRLLEKDIQHEAPDGEPEIF